MNRFHSKSFPENPKSTIQKRPRRPKWAGFVALVVTLAMCGAVAAAQQPGKVYRIGYLSATHRDRHAPRFQVFRQGLRELGYVEGRNVTITDRYAEGKAERIPELVAELIHLNVDVILAGGSQAAGPAKEATRTIPIVVVHFEDPVWEGFVTSLARPGGNITGLSRMSSDLEGKRLELLKETIPKVRRVALFLNPANPTDVLIFGEADSAARGLGLQLQRLEVRSLDDLDGAFAILTKDQAHALMPSADPLLNLLGSYSPQLAALGILRVSRISIPRSLLRGSSLLIANGLLISRQETGCRPCITRTLTWRLEV